MECSSAKRSALTSGRDLSGGRMNSNHNHKTKQALNPVIRSKTRQTGRTQRGGGSTFNTSGDKKSLI